VSRAEDGQWPYETSEDVMGPRPDLRRPCEPVTISGCSLSKRPRDAASSALTLARTDIFDNTLNPGKQQETIYTVIA
jgi:hypothetical protein